MNRYRLNEAHKPKPVIEEPKASESMADYVSKDRADRMPKIKVQDERVTKQRKALGAYTPVHRSA